MGIREQIQKPCGGFVRRLFLAMCIFLPITADAAVDYQTGLNGTWWNPEQDGQGFVIHVIPEADQVFVAWFTYKDTGGDQMWITASGSLSESPANLELLRPGGGALNAAEPTPDLVKWGEGTLEFESCTRATFTYSGESSGSIQIERLTPLVACEEAQK